MHDISTDEDARLFAKEDLGYSESPVVYLSGEHFAGFFEDRLDEFLETVQA